MAKINLYVGDELKERMDAAGDINWSNIARSAFLTALATLNDRRTPTWELVPVQRMPILGEVRYMRRLVPSPAAEASGSVIEQWNRVIWTGEDWVKESDG
jgi:hypothetical protein